MKYFLLSSVLSGLAAFSYNASAAPTRVQKIGDPVLIDPGAGYIRATRLLDGSILAGFGVNDGSAHVLRAARSTDSGAHWTRIGEVARVDGATHDTDNADLLQLPSGRVLYAFRNHDRAAPNADTYVYYRITLCYSDDGGVTWRFLSQIDERKAGNVKNGLWEPFLRLAADGTLQAYYAAENQDDDQDTLMRYSRDGGATWSERITVSGADRISRDGMPGVANIDGNRNVICVFENTEGGNPSQFSVDYVISHDDGYTWGERGRLYTAHGGTGKTAGSPQVWNVGGTLVASFMTNEDVDVPQLDGGQMKVSTSTDGGKTWSAAVVTGEKGSHWPGLLSTDSTRFLALYGKDGLGGVSQMYQLV